ncbi:hypothetical protein BJX61DRAFT_509748 [Aspergillus egyptiacus]|nr:hypothetical protein BJX61DRAFT_509748 [Aspergillus egyptiacus]
MDTRLRHCNLFFVSGAIVGRISYFHFLRCTYSGRGMASDGWTDGVGSSKLFASRVPASLL